MKAVALATAALAALGFLPTVALAHQAGLSYGTLRLEGNRVELALRFSASELRASWPDLSASRGGGDSALAAAKDVFGSVRQSQGGDTCASGPVEMRPEAPDAVELSGLFRCPREGASLQVRLGFLARMPPGHVHLTKVVLGRDVQEHVLDAQRDSLELVVRTSLLQQAGPFVVLGVKHIFTGWDHVAFLLGLLLAGGALREVVRVVTAFTVAHALTLSLATLGMVTPPPAVVEPLIAASVACVGVESLLAIRRRSAVGRRWAFAFAFGLVHGFGFAAALKELRLPGSGLAAALFSFNLGVELGQAAIVATMFPILAGLRRRRRLAAALPMGSIAVGLAGVVWLVQRLP